MTMLPFGQVAPISRRVIAYLIDAAIAFGVALLLGAIGAALVIATDPGAQIGAMFGASAIVLVGAAAWAVVYTIMQGGAGSVGMRAQRLRLVREESGAPIGFGKALLRNIVFWLTCTIVVGYFSALFDGTGRFQGWHDKAVGVLMLDGRSRTLAEHSPGSTTHPEPARPSPPFGGLASAPTGAASPLPPMPGVAPSAPVAAAAPMAMTAEQGTAPHTSAIDETQASPSAPHGGSVIAFVPGVTQDRAPQVTAAASEPNEPTLHAAQPVPPMPANIPPVPSLPPVPPLPTAPIDVTVVREDIAPRASEADEEADVEQTRISIPGHRLVFTWDDGTKAAVSRRTIFGRNPAPEEGAIIVAVRDETLSLSKTHFEAGAQARGGWVMDRHSTNGTMLVRDGHRIACVPGERVEVRLGDALEIGDRIVTIGGYA